VRDKRKHKKRDWKSGAPPREKKNQSVREESPERHPRGETKKAQLKNYSSQKKREKRQYNPEKEKNQRAKEQRGTRVQRVPMDSPPRGQKEVDSRT